MSWREDLLKWLAKKLKVELPKEFVSPVSRILELSDSSDKFYVWVFEENVSEDLLKEYHDAVSSVFVKRFNRDPRALHIFSKGDHLKAVESLSAAEVKGLVLPWLSENLKK